LVLFTDADVHFAAGALRAAVALTAAHGLDHLAAIPQFESVGGVVDVEVAGGLRGLLTVQSAMSWCPWSCSAVT
jgi:hypothetical protein